MRFIYILPLVMALLGHHIAVAAPFAYITNTGSNSVSVIDTATNTVVATVAVGFAPLGVAVNPAGTRVYVANNGSNNVSVIDTATNTVAATVAVGFSPDAFGLFIGPAPTSLDQAGIPYLLPAAALGFAVLIVLGRLRRQRG